MQVLSWVEPVVLLVQVVRAGPVVLEVLQVSMAKPDLWVLRELMARPMAAMPETEERVPMAQMA